MKHAKSVTGLLFLIFLGMLVSGFTPQGPEDTRPRKNPVPETADSIERGKNLFQINCAGCHGKRADGRGPQALNLIPKPQNLRNANFIVHLNDERLYTSISGGVRGTSMPAFELNIPEQGRWDIINYIRSLSEETAEEIPADPVLETVDPGLKDPIPKNEASIEAGETLYMKYCISCHGVNLDGNGPVAENLRPRPRNLAVITSWGESPFLDYLQDSRIFDSITNGVAGTSMQPWGKVLSTEQRWHLINFIRSQAELKQTDYEQSFTE